MKKSSRVKLATTAIAAARAAATPGGPSLPDRLSAVPRLAKATVTGVYTGTSKGRLALVAAAAAYLVSPLDLIPEAVVPILGVADDAVVLAWFLRTLIHETDQFLTWEKQVGVGGTTVRGAVADDVTGAAAPGARGSEGRGAARRSLTSTTIKDLNEDATASVMESMRRRLER